MAYISVVSPVYGCKETLYELTFRLTEALKTITTDFEIIYVDDNSPDQAWDMIKALVLKDSRVKGVRFSRNFGQHYAITAGLNYCSGEWIVVMDCDLQDKPEEIINLHNKALEGYDAVFGKRTIRQDGWMKKKMSVAFYRMFDILTDNTSDSSLSNFGIFSQKVISNYLRLTERIRIFPLLVKWLGYKIGYITVEHLERKSGKSAYTFFKLIKLALNVIISQTNKPLRISVKIGFLLSFLSIAYLAWLVIRRFYLDIPMGWTSIMVAIFFMGGLILANIGLMGIYIGKIFDEVKNRPLYIISEVSENLKK